MHAAVEAIKDVLVRKLSFSDVPDDVPTTTTSAPERLKVWVRARPLAAGTEASEMHLTDSSVALRTVKSSAQGKVEVEEVSYAFDGVFNAESTQAEVFQSAMLPQVRSLLAGRDTLTFAYGITNAGKTHTIQGSESGDGQGAIPRALECIFRALDAHKAHTAPRTGEDGAEEDATMSVEELAAAGLGLGALDPQCSYELKASFLEVYGNDAFDLLAPPEARTVKDANGKDKRVVLRLKEDKAGQVFVEGLKEVELPDLETARRAVQLGWQQRAIASNSINDVSSRSHAVLVLKLLSHRPGVEAAPTTTRLCVVDLAGAERQKKTGSNGTRLNEAKSINQDLMVLGACLRDLRYNQTHGKSSQRLPPFRDSRITMLFRDYLSGNGQISVIAAVSPRAADASATLDTLNFAAIARKVSVVEAPKPERQKSAPAPPLPRVALGHAKSQLSSRGEAGGGAKEAAAGGHAAGAPAAARAEGGGFDESESMRSSSGGWASAAEEEIGELRRQVEMLNELLLKAQTDDRVRYEREIRAEAGKEMREYQEKTDAEYKERLEKERYDLEEAYLKRETLFKGNQEKRNDAASLEIHTKLQQHTRESQVAQLKFEEQVAKLNAEVEKACAERNTALVELNVLRADTPTASALADAEVAKQAAEAAAAEEVTKRAQVEEKLATVEAHANRSQHKWAEKVGALEAALDENRAHAAQLQARVEELEPLVAVIEEMRRSRTSHTAEDAPKPSPAKPASRSQRRLSALGDHDDENGHEGGARGLGSPSRALDDATNSMGDDMTDSPQKLGRRLSSRMAGGRRGSALATAPGEEGGAAAAKTSKLSKLKHAVPGGLFRKAKADTALASDVILEICEPQAPPEPTPIARRTRGAGERKGVAK